MVDNFIGQYPLLTQVLLIITSHGRMGFIASLSMVHSLNDKQIKQST